MFGQFLVLDTIRLRKRAAIELRPSGLSTFWVQYLPKERTRSATGTNAISPKTGHSQIWIL